MLGIDLEYNFFESNHGHSVCDSVASQAKKRLGCFQQDNETPINSSQEIVEVLEGIKNHKPDIAETCSFDESFQTFHGIRTCHKFKFSETEALGYSISDDKSPSKAYKLNSESFNFLLE